MIREAIEADKFRLIEMASRFITSSRYNELLVPDPVRIGNLVDKALEHGVIWVDDYQSSVLRPDRRLVSMLAMIGPIEHHLTGQQYAEELAWWVEPEVRHLGFGAALLQHMEAWAVQNRVTVVKMLAPSDSSIGDFYKTRGYRAVETAWVRVFDT